ncbi:transposase [Chryseobacterium sp. ERMR1:04]|uniref:transposase n=1 Tax=Chryseobacterium sp. ERMR1:04 TaxID=1705393 RepID=UPI0006C84DC4|nr:transposase [Chryseobacterium sp. ERMR1:04]KPH13839.1 transposase [Chryseobacterium sp. ERMR1:04]
MQNLKDIHIGSLIKKRVTECDINMSRICNFLNCDEELINEMYLSDSLNSHYLLKWSKLLEYDFFRLYSQHLILYSPQASIKSNQSKIEKTSLPQFRKNIYTKEIVDFVIEMIDTQKKTKIQIIKEYKIPKTTLYKWIAKYKKTDDN